MDRGPKWFLKSSNGLWSACAVLGDNSLSVSLPPSTTYVCACLSVSVFVRACVYMCVCVWLPHALPDSLAGRWQRWWSGSLEMR